MKYCWHLGNSTIGNWLIGYGEKRKKIPTFDFWFRFRDENTVFSHFLIRADGRTHIKQTNKQKRKKQTKNNAAVLKFLFSSSSIIHHPSWIISIKLLLLTCYEVVVKASLTVGRKQNNSNEKFIFPTNTITGDFFSCSFGCHYRN